VGSRRCYRCRHGEGDKNGRTRPDRRRRTDPSSAAALELLLLRFLELLLRRMMIMMMVKAGHGTKERRGGEVRRVDAKFRL
jgi:hypothetical protein